MGVIVFAAICALMFGVIAIGDLALGINADMAIIMFILSVLGLRLELLDEKVRRLV